MTTPPFFSLVIVNFHSAFHLEEALASLYQHETDQSLFEVIVVNNDAQEALAVNELTRTFPFLRIVHAPANRGLGAGVNQGAQIALGDILGILNPDLFWKEPVLELLKQAFLGDEKMGVAGLSLLSQDGQRERWSFGAEPTLMHILRSNFGQEKKLPKTPEKGVVAYDWVSGGALFVRAGLFRALRGFDENFFLYFEDVDLCRRVRERGFSVQLFPKLAVYHKGGQSHGSRRAQKRFYYQSQTRYFRKHASFAQYALLSLFRFLRHGC